MLKSNIGRTICSDPNDFDSHYYLLNNTDVADAIKNGLVKSAWDHFIRHGFYEKRPWRIKVQLHGLDFESIINNWQKKRSGKHLC